MKLAFWRKSKKKLALTSGKREFEGASNGRLFSNWASNAYRTYDDEIRVALTQLRERARHLAQNNEYIKRYISLSKVNVIGSEGVRLHCRFKTKQKGNLLEKENQAIENRWRLWGEKGSCDVTGKLSFVEVQNLVYTHYIRDGEAFVRFVNLKEANKEGFCLQVIDPSMIDENVNEEFTDGSKISMGIHVDKYERPLAYYLKAKSGLPGSETIKGHSYLKIPAKEIIHFYKQERASQSRGVTSLHAIIKRLQLLHGYQESEAVGAKIGASKMGFFKKTMEDAGEFMGDDEGLAKNEFGDVHMKVQAGMFQKLPVGWDFQSFDSKHPDGNYEPFIKSTLKGVASGLNTSYNMLANDYESVNYSSLRASFLLDRDSYEADQNFFIDNFIRPVYREWLKYASYQEAIPVRASEIDYFKNPVFQGRRWSWVDPLKDAEANIALVQAGVKTLTEVCAERGRAIEDVLTEREREIKLMKEKGISNEENAKKGDSDASTDE